MRLNWTRHASRDLPFSQAREADSPIGKFEILPSRRRSIGSQRFRLYVSGRELDRWLVNMDAACERAELEVSRHMNLAKGEL